MTHDPEAHDDCCRDAKLVVLDWDELSGGIRTSSLHSWESSIPTLKLGQHAFPRAPKAYADPQVFIQVLHSISARACAARSKGAP